MTRSIGLLPYEADASGMSPCHRKRFYWFDWPANAGDDVEIQKPLTCKSNDYGRITFGLPSPPENLIEPGWSLAGGAHHKLPTFTTAQPKAPPGFMPAEIETCSDRRILEGGFVQVSAIPVQVPKWFDSPQARLEDPKCSREGSDVGLPP